MQVRKLSRSAHSFRYQSECTDIHLLDIQELSADIHVSKGMDKELDIKQHFQWRIRQGGTNLQQVGDASNDGPF